MLRASETQEAPSSEPLVERVVDDHTEKNGTSPTASVDELERMFPKPKFALQEDTMDIKESILMQVRCRV